ncbi:DUF6404 family protein [Luteimonas sp BLCC-B24]|uniref:DUF6404 family protein n=1 Tax=Luteimonas sp. BLCC-B24 TaxID=3025317 RepID=UPI00234C6EB6|nr:DUF6404 family protein [Luteimonas sp. BLCC-B24]MDC7806798.1 DUF6404 family protein [Luteimonas sp. BLCC-B24]
MTNRARGNAFQARLDAALALMAKRGIRPMQAQPPVVRLLWRAGLQLPPPLMASFSTNLLTMGALFMLLWAPLTWGTVRWMGMPDLALAIATGAPCAGLLYGVAMAALLQRMRRRHSLPEWRALGP